jgi:hypothetical protein
MSLREALLLALLDEEVEGMVVVGAELLASIAGTAVAEGIRIFALDDLCHLGLGGGLIQVHVRAPGEAVRGGADGTVRRVK